MEQLSRVMFSDEFTFWQSRQWSVAKVEGFQAVQDTRLQLPLVVSIPESVSLIVADSL